MSGYSPGRFRGDSPVGPTYAFLRSKDILPRMPDQTGAGGSSSAVHPLTDDVVAGAWTALAIVATGYHLLQSGTVPGWLIFLDSLAILAAIRFVFGNGSLDAATDVLKRFKK